SPEAEVIEALPPTRPTSTSPEADFTSRSLSTLSIRTSPEAVFTDREDAAPTSISPDATARLPRSSGTEIRTSAEAVRALIEVPGGATIRTRARAERPTDHFSWCTQMWLPLWPMCQVSGRLVSSSTITDPGGPGATVNDPVGTDTSRSAAPSQPSLSPSTARTCPALGNRFGSDRHVSGESPPPSG